ncbi:hypothetical protein C1646_782022 [Rhizophagus diaphanus]|nr:hypothetical protein C1646_782022 [Rhizophagus diaphanus] [Rhizophagus sp. MUCL 43196]
MYIYEHGKKYTCKSAKKTSTKKMLYLWYVNASCPKVNNPDSAIFINKIVDEYNYDLSVKAVKFREEIHKLLDKQDKKNIYQYWKFAIPSVKNQKYANFLFTEMDKYCQSFLMPAILKLQRDKINQFFYYAINLIDKQDIVVINEVSYDDEYAKSSQTTIEQLIEVSNHDNVKKIWAVRVGNLLMAKHYVILLK